MTSGAPICTVVIGATRQGSLPAAIRSVQRQTFDRWELLLIGQGEDAGIREVASRWQLEEPRIRYLHLAHRGLSRARNAGLEVSRGAWVAMMDDDCEASPDWLAVLAARFQADPELGLIGGSMLAPPKPAGHGFGRCPHWEPAEASFDSARESRPPEGFGIVGGNFALRREVAMRIGRFDESFGVGAEFPAAEEMDYLFRAFAHGVKVVATPSAVVHHSDGWRFGYRTVLRHQRQRGLGNGALAAKRMMRGDAGGREELDALLGKIAKDLIHLRRPEGAWYTPHFWLGYRRCVRGYVLGTDGTLRPRQAQSHGIPASGDAVA